VSGAVNCVFVFLLFNLILLHLYLIAKGISTYEFIVAQREEERRQKEGEEGRRKGGESHKVVYPAELAAGKQENETSSNEGLGEKRRREEKFRQEEEEPNTQQTHLVRVGSRSSGVNEGKGIIFGEKDGTEKSEGKVQGEGEHEADRESGGDSDGSSNVQLSQLFTRNKSLKLIIGHSDYYRPHKPQKEQERGKMKSMFI
jgi:hypothetical protein